MKIRFYPAFPRLDHEKNGFFPGMNIHRKCLLPDISSGILRKYHYLKVSHAFMRTYQKFSYLSGAAGKIYVDLFWHS